MPYTHAKVELPFITGLPRDVAVNDFTMLHTLPGDAGLYEDVCDAIIAFYNRDAGTTFVDGESVTRLNPVAWYLSPVLSRFANAASVTLYDLTEAEIDAGDVGAPVAMKLFTLGPTTTDGLPPQIALGVTFEAEGRAVAPVESGGIRPKQRHTGGIRLGPVSSSTLGTTGTIVGRPIEAFVNAVFVACNDLENDLAALPFTGGLGVWSRSDGVVRPTEAISIDDAFDALDSRKLTATGRRRMTT